MFWWYKSVIGFNHVVGMRCFAAFLVVPNALETNGILNKLRFSVGDWSLYRTFGSPLKKWQSRACWLVIIPPYAIVRFPAKKKKVKNLNENKIPSFFTCHLLFGLGTKKQKPPKKHEKKHIHRTPPPQKKKHVFDKLPRYALRSSIAFPVADDFAGRQKRATRLGAKTTAAAGETSRYGYSYLLNMPLCPTNNVNMANCVLLSMMKKMLKWLDRIRHHVQKILWGQSVRLWVLDSFGVLICFLLRHLHFPTVMFAHVGIMEISKLMMDTKITFPNIWGLGFCECLRNGDRYNSQSIGIFHNSTQTVVSYFNFLRSVQNSHSFHFHWFTDRRHLFVELVLEGIVSTSESTSKIHPQRFDGGNASIEITKGQGVRSS